MKFVPRHGHICGRLVIKRVLSVIIRPDDTKNTSKFLLVDAVGPGAAAAGISVGDVVVPTSLGNIVLDGGALFRPYLEEKFAAFHVTEVDITKDFDVQTDSGAKYVPFDSEEAAQSMGANPEPVETDKAAE